MVNAKKLKARMIISGHTQKSLVAELESIGVHMSENTLSAKMRGKSQFFVDEAVAICDILQITNGAEKAEIFLP